MPNLDREEFETLLNGLSRIPRAQPKRDLLPGIEARIARPEAAVIPVRQWRSMIAAALLLLLLNVAALTYYSSQSTSRDQGIALVTDYQLYE